MRPDTEAEKKDESQASSSSTETNSQPTAITGAEQGDQVAPGAIGDGEVRRLKRVFSDYIDEVRVNNSHFTNKEYQAERKAWFSRNVPGDSGLEPSDFEFPFDPKNPPKVDDDRASDDE